ncbi:hypothetical protein Sxan_14990 [Streptomyces xanthophaeus]|uniref:Uncharacterized protein n=1 Tax=Streptomyces xanthophaeus TaxID=67385 RepID=A0A919GTY1_9ACTN|nr:hypothetical protein Sxan_14990 [Streptomyces xanthophaeus]
MRWRLSDTKVDVQKETRHSEAEEPRHTVNLDYFHTGEVHEISGHHPGQFFSDPQINPALQRVPRELSGQPHNEEYQFEHSHEQALRPAGTFSPSSYRSEAALQRRSTCPRSSGMTTARSSSKPKPF